MDGNHYNYYFIIIIILLLLLLLLLENTTGFGKGTCALQRQFCHSLSQLCLHVACLFALQNITLGAYLDTYKIFRAFMEWR